jgi:hypothetical protein
MARPISKTTKFILSLPKTLPAKEVLAKAKARGIETSENNVHRVRRLRPVVAAKGRSNEPAGTPAKQVVEKAKAAGIPSPKPTAAKSLSVRAKVPGAAIKVGASSADELLRAVAAELGLARAVDILQKERARVQAVLGS